MTPLHILIVEDEIITAMDLRQTLEEAGHRVIGIARTLQAAVKAVKAQPPDLALIDIQLDASSTGDGLATARELLAHHPMPIIYLTANSDPEAFRAAKDTLPTAYLLKPFRPDELKLHVEVAYHYFQSTLLNPVPEPTPSHLFLPIGKGHEKILLNDVLYAEADGAYVKIYMADKIIHTVSTNLSHLAQYFRTPNFFRLSRFHLVNIDHIRRLKDNGLVMADNQATLPIPAASRKELLKKLTVVRTK